MVETHEAKRTRLLMDKTCEIRSTVEDLQKALESSDQDLARPYVGFGSELSSLVGEMLTIGES